MAGQLILSSYFLEASHEINMLTVGLETCGWSNSVCNLKFHQSKLSAILTLSSKGELGMLKIGTSCLAMHRKSCRCIWVVVDIDIGANVASVRHFI